MLRSGLFGLLLAFTAADAPPAVTGWLDDASRELTALAPEAVPDFRAGVLDVRSQRYARAESLLVRVQDAAPEFVPGLLALARAREHTGQVLSARHLLEQAVSLRRDGSTILALGENLILGDAPLPDRERSIALAREVIADEPSSFRAQLLLARAAAPLAAVELGMRSYRDILAAAAARMMAIDPDDPHGPYFAACASVEAGDWSRAEELGDRAYDLGAPLSAITRLRSRAQRLQETMPRTLMWQWMRRIGGIAVAWGVIMLAIHGIGRYCCRRTLAIIGAEGVAPARLRATWRLRRAYRGLLMFAGAWYYISVVLVAVLLTTVAALLISLRVHGTDVSWILLVAAGFAGLVSILTALLTLLYPGPRDAVVRPLTPAEAPRVWDVLREVAGVMGTRPVDEVRLQFDADIAVNEVGRLHDRLTGRARRVLYLGVGLLDGLDLNAFKAMLAHEYGHFAHGDVAIGVIASRVLGGTAATGMVMESLGLTTLWNVSYWFLLIYHQIIARITVGASRLQEALADSLAARTYGGPTFTAALYHSAHQSLVYAAATDAEFKAAIREPRPLGDIFAVSGQLDGETAAEVEQEWERLLAAPADTYDPYPSLADRVRLAEHAAPDGPASDDGRTAWDLFPDRDGLLAEMAELARKRFEEIREDLAASIAAAEDEEDEGAPARTGGADPEPGRENTEPDEA